jgi:hypothetical protein
VRLGLQRFDLSDGQPPKLTASPGSVQNGDLEVLRRHGPVLHRGQNVLTELEGVFEVGSVGRITFLQGVAELIGLAAPGHPSLPVGDRAVVEDMEQLVFVRRCADRGHQYFALVRLHL